MIYPIVVYGSPILRKQSVDIDKDYPDLKKLVDDMFLTMYSADGVGLAAPQIGKNIRLFVVDATPVGRRRTETERFQTRIHQCRDLRTFRRRGTVQRRVPVVARTT